MTMNKNGKKMAQEDKSSLISDKFRDWVGVELRYNTPELLNPAFVHWELGPELPPNWEIGEGLTKRFASVIRDPNPLWETTLPPTALASLEFVHRMVLFSASVLRDSEIPVGTNAGEEWAAWNLNSNLPFLLNGGEGFEYFVPVREGDIITCTGKIVAGEEHLARKGDKNVVHTIQIDYTNQRGEQTTRLLGTFISKPRMYDSSTDSQTAAVKQEATGRQLTYKVGDQLTYDDVEVGDVLPTLLQPLATRRLVHWASVSRDFSEMHYDKDFAQRLGLKGVIAHGALLSSFLGQVLTDFMGLKGVLKRFWSQYRKPQYPGDDAICKGKIAKKYIKGDEHYVELDVWIENPRGELCVTGRATLVLPN